MKKAALVFVPLSGMGHLVSTVEVAKLLLNLNTNLSIAVLVIKPLPSSPTITAKFDSLFASTTSTRIKFIHLPQVECDKRGPPGQLVATFVQNHTPHIKDAVTNIVRDCSSVPGSPQLAGLVLDMFFTPLMDLANEFGVPSYVFHTSGAAFLGFQFFLKALHDEQKLNITELKNSDTEFSIPSYANPVSSKFFPSVVFQPESLNKLLNMAEELCEVKGIMVNTFSELESHAVHSLSGGEQQQAVYAVGPILNLESSSEADQNRADIMEWLDEQPPSSVVFICFGSMGSFSEDQAKEIARALEQSGHRFLWSLRRPPINKVPMSSPTDYEDVAEVLPQGFLERTATTGKIIGWAPQTAVLGHPAVGGFVSHCGWNSTLESIWFGVPTATWPLYAEQQLNAFEIVKELGMGVEIKMDYKKEPWGKRESKS